MGKKTVVFGSFVVDLMGRTPHLPAAGETVKGTVFKMGPGGKGFNQGVAAHKAGADEVDMVINISALKDKDDKYVEDDIRAVVEASKGAVVKVIIENCLLTDEEKVRACELSVKAGADFVKTSTGFSTGGATIEDVALMKKTVGERAKVKASGGIRTPEAAKALVEAGADRIGAGNGIVLL